MNWSSGKEIKCPFGGARPDSLDRMEGQRARQKFGLKSERGGNFGLWMKITTWVEVEILL